MSELYLALSLSSWLDTILRLSVTAGVVLLAVLGADVLLARRVFARWRAALYLAVLVRLALPASWGSPVGLVARESAGAPVASVVTTQSEGIRASVTSAVAPTAASRPWPAALLLQAGLAAALLATWGIARLLAARSLRGARLASPRVIALAGGRPVLEHPARGPAVYGIVAPRIVVPTPLVERLDDAALGAVLRHEAAHVARRDPWTLALVQLATFACWPLLPAWIAAWRVRGLMEQACDEAALSEAGAGERRAYGEALIRVAEWQPLRARLALGMLPFGGGLAPRLRALRFTRRWPALAQVALVAAIGTATVLASGEREVRAEPERIAGIAVFRAEIFQGGGELPPDAVAARVPLTLTEDGETSVTFVQLVDAVAARSALADAAPLGDHRDHRTWIGSPLFANYRFGSLAGPDPAEQEKARVVIRFGATLRDEALEWDLGLAQGGILQGRTSIEEGQGVLFDGPALPGGVVRVLLTPANVEWSDGAPSFDTPRADFEVDGDLVLDALEQFRTTFGLPVPLEGGVGRMVHVALKDAPAQEILHAIADAAGLVPVRDAKSQMWKLVDASPPAPAAESVVLPLGAIPEKQALDAVRPLLTPGGDAQVDRRAGVLIVRDMPEGLARARAAFGALSGALVSNKSTAAGQGSALIRSFLTGPCEASVTEGDILGVIGTCATPLDLAHLLRSMEDDGRLADISLLEQVNDGASGKTVFSVSARWRDAGSARRDVPRPRDDADRGQPESSVHLVQVTTFSRVTTMPTARASTRLGGGAVERLVMQGQTREILGSIARVESSTDLLECGPGRRAVVRQLVPAVSPNASFLAVTTIVKAHAHGSSLELSLGWSGSDGEVMLNHGTVKTMRLGEPSSGPDLSRSELIEVPSTLAEGESVLLLLRAGATMPWTAVVFTPLDAPRREESGDE